MAAGLRAAAGPMAAGTKEAAGLAQQAMQAEEIAVFGGGRRHAISGKGHISQLRLRAEAVDNCLLFSGSHVVCSVSIIRLNANFKSNS